MMGNPGVPDVGNAHVLDFFQGFIRKAIELAHAVFFDGSPRFVGCIGVAKKTGENLVNDHFM